VNKLRQIVETARIHMNSNGDITQPAFHVIKMIATMEDSEFRHLCRIISLGFMEDMQDV